MGFFSSRRAEDTEIYAPATTKDSNDKSVAHVIRSRFYGKNKGKERDDHRSTSFSASGASVAQTLSSPPPSSSAYIRQPSPLSKSQNAAKSAGPSILRVQLETKSLPPTPSRKSPYTSNMGPPPSPSPSRVSSAAALRHQNSNIVAPIPRQPTDNVTMTLAQRLNELAVANSEGLLNDDEYRLLRQDLFERFATSTTVPMEAPVVPVSRPRPRGASTSQEGNAIPRPLSNFQVEVNRTSSIRSKSSIGSGVASFLRRATSRRTPSGSNDYSDTSSIFSSASISSNFFKRGLSKKSSSSSVRTTTSRTQADAISISSRAGPGSPSDYSPHPPLSASRSTASIRRYATPPSSFPSRIIGIDAPRNSAFAGDMQDEEHVQTSAEIRQEIAAVEAEVRRLMDAFNGLEMTTLAKLQRHQGRLPLQENTAPTDSAWMLNAETRSQRRIVIADSDAASLKSATSAGTSASMARSAHSGSKARSKGSLNPSSLNAARTGSLHRKNSSSSVGSQEWKAGGRSNIPPVPALPASYGNLGVGSVSNVSLTRRMLQGTMNAVPENGPPMPDLKMEEGRTEKEMDDIRRRREEVSERYAARLEYLRAKLKGAQLHEKLARK
ncbi:hypothetical protein LshimejAT787_0501690 [Lyophyllum shimeji]|uniref:Uncharacterized protein n=1 Tax=Lyophyllum shimeji TaxID=47721 RepID=A0A9P3UKM9_LYOSH|nr:hypothetical protein LshimejAT787_0501690 [Lyophyllum shimeji]